MSKSLVEEVKQLLSQKRSRAFYAKKLNTSIDKIDEAIRVIRSQRSPKEDIVHKEANCIDTFTQSINVSGYYKLPPTAEQVASDHRIDTSKWKLSTFWSKQKEKGFQVSALFSPIKLEKEDYTKAFTDFLGSYKPKPYVGSTSKSSHNKTGSCLIFNKQDAHYNKFSVDGNNNIDARFETVYNKTAKILRKASYQNNLEKVIYAIGSDEFNSESTGSTTHSTPQQNIGTYEQSFESICNHEISLIDLILTYTENIEILYIPGNHDFNTGWHLASWLSAYYRNYKNIKFTIQPTFSKYIKYSNTALMFNHGYKIKPEQLAQNFPMEFKSGWANSDYHYIFVGDLHTELSKEIGGIKFFRLAQMSKAVSNWDAERGYTLSKGVMTAFLVEEGNGITDTYREFI